MKLLRVLCLLCGLATGAVLASVGAGETPLVVAVQDERIDLSANTSLLEDPSGQLDFATVSSAAYADKFTRRKPQGGQTDAAVWVRFTLSNPGDQPLTRWFDTGNRTLWELDVYAQESNGHTTHQSTGAFQPFAQRPLPTADFVFPLELGARQTLTLYVRMRTYLGTPTNIRPALWQADVYRKLAQSEKTQ